MKIHRTFEKVSAASQQRSHIRPGFLFYASQPCSNHKAVTWGEGHTPTEAIHDMRAWMKVEHQGYARWIASEALDKPIERP